MNYILLKLADDEGPDGCTVLGLMKVNVESHQEARDKYAEKWVHIHVNESYENLIEPLPLNEYLTLDEVGKLTDINELEELWSE